MNKTTPWTKSPRIPSSPKKVWPGRKDPRPGQSVRSQAYRYSASSEPGLKAHALFTKDVDYIVKQGQVIIVDEFTGRLMPGRRYSDGLHQGFGSQGRGQNRKRKPDPGSITFQNYFRMYDKTGRMTGTADTEAEEFAKIYKLDVVVIPPTGK